MTPKDPIKTPIDAPAGSWICTCGAVFPSIQTASAHAAKDHFVARVLS